MRKCTPKLLSAAVVFLSAVCFCACGQKQVSSYAGVYQSMRLELENYALTGEEAAGASVTLENDGSCRIDTGEDIDSFRWSVQDGVLSLEGNERRMVGEITENTITFDDFLDTGVLVTFGKEGTDAMTPAFYFTETEKNMIGTWQSVSVINLFDEDASAETAPDGLTLEIRDDKTVTITRNGKAFDTMTWNVFDGEAFVDIDISWVLNDAELTVDYYIGDDWYTYTCVKK